MPIPRRIIQTHQSESVLRELRSSWQSLNPDFEYLFFDDAQCAAFVARHAPAMLTTYQALPLPVQKADVFRYIAVQTLGGFYADVDTVCCAPLESYIDFSGESLVVCPEMLPADWPQGELQYTHLFCSPRQLGQWAFCAPPGHPALGVLLERIRYMVAGLNADQLRVMSGNMRFTLETTGPHMFTRVVDEFLSESREGAVTVLPRLAWGASVSEQADASLADQFKLRHLFDGSWLPGRSKQVQKPFAPVTFKLQY